jgi:hypothetical protein
MIFCTQGFSTIGDMKAILFFNKNSQTTLTTVTSMSASVTSTSVTSTSGKSTSISSVREACVELVFNKNGLHF